MSSPSWFKHHPVALAAVLSASLAAVPLVSFAAAPHETGPKACRSDEEEAALLKRETSQIGLRHAQEHAQMRLVQCEVERGVRGVPGKGLLKSPKDSLDEDEAVKKSVLDKVAEIKKAKEEKKNPPGKPLPQEATLGRWSSPFPIPVVGVTSVLLHTGRVMFWSYDPFSYGDPSASMKGVGYLWNPASRQGYGISPPENLWCGGQTILSDGRVYVAGGNLRYPDASAPEGQRGSQGTLTNYLFNPSTETWLRQPDMAHGRWYPTVTKLADNRVVVTSGLDETGADQVNNAVEVFTPNPDVSQPGSISSVSIHNSSGLYPLQFLMPSGKMLEAGPEQASSYQLDPANWNWSTVPYLSSHHLGYANGISYTNAAVAPARQLVMVGGGHDRTTVVANNEWLDGNNPAAGWKPYPQWKQARHNANMVILPDGTLLTLGGNAGLGGYDNPVFSAELYSQPADNTTGSWQRVAPHAIQAAYHSTAILLPDATVLLSQDDMDTRAASEHKAQIYSPPYLFKGSQPVITQAPASLQVGQTFTVTTDRGNMTSAVLVAPGATTHANDMHQRAIKLPAKPLANGLSATVPASSALVPPGYYMLFVLDAEGIPSVAKFVRIT